jgi:RecA-family ATPase
MTEQELSKETDAKLLMDWNDHLRVEFGISTIIIHHHRKAQTGNKRPNSIADIYGSHYFTARATTVMTLWDPKKSGLIEVSFQKMRMAAPEKAYAIQRKDDLTFETSSARIEFVDDTIDITDEATPVEATTEEWDF